MCILFAEDDRDLSRAVKALLEHSGYSVDVVDNGLDAVDYAASGAYDGMILDWMMPGLSGVQVLEKLRGQGNAAPCLMLTAREEEADKVMGLELGADDYITKPYSIAEVLARVRSVLRRSERRSRPVNQVTESSDSNIITFEGLEVNNLNKRCFIDGSEIQLTRKEFDILVLLLTHRGKILSREQIMKQVWSDEVVVLDRTIDVNITRMRKKLGQYGNHIVTRTGYGYGFEV